MAVAVLGCLEASFVFSISKACSAKVVSSGPTFLMEITQELFQSKLSSYPDTLLAIMKTLSNRAREKFENV